MKKQPKSDIMAAVYETAEDLHTAGVLPMQTLREFDELCWGNETRGPEMSGTLQAHRVETTLTEDGTLTLQQLPFQAGEAVEVIVLPNLVLSSSPGEYSLRGTPLSYREPAEPVGEQDWEASA